MLFLVSVVQTNLTSTPDDAYQVQVKLQYMMRIWDVTYKSKAAFRLIQDPTVTQPNLHYLTLLLQIVKKIGHFTMEWHV